MHHAEKRVSLNRTEEADTLPDRVSVWIALSLGAHGPEG